VGRGVGDRDNESIVPFEGLSVGAAETTVIVEGVGNVEGAVLGESVIEYE